MCGDFSIHDDVEGLTEPFLEKIKRIRMPKYSPCLNTVRFTISVFKKTSRTTSRICWVSFQNSRRLCKMIGLIGSFLEKVECNYN